MLFLDWKPPQIQLGLGFFHPKIGKTYENFSAKIIDNPQKLALKQISEPLKGGPEFWRAGERRSWGVSKNFYFEFQGFSSDFPGILGFQKIFLGDSLGFRNG